MKKDELLEKNFPLAPVADDGSFAEPERYGIRYLVGNSGLWLDAWWPWMRVRYLVKPFREWGLSIHGDPQPELSLPKLDPRLFAEFVRLAKAALPNEMGAWVLYKPDTGAQRLVIPPQTNSPDSVHYDRPIPEGGEYAVWDIHSHGLYPAYFSPTDNRDDQYDVKIAMVVGNLDRDEQSMVARLVVREHTLPLRKGEKL